MIELWDRRALLSWREELHRAGLRLVFTNGCFDVLHVGHVRQLQQAAEYGDRLIVALNSDESVRYLKGHDRPVVPLEDRAEILLALQCVDRVTAFDEETPLQIISSLKPEVLVKGGDYAPDDVVGKDVVEAAGGRVEIIPLVPGRSSSELLRKIRELG